MGTINLLQLSQKFGTKKFIFASSGGAIYGDPKKLPANEETPIKPLSPYGISKHAAELFIQQSQLNHTILRYSNVYGIRQDPSGEAGVIAVFAEKMLKKETPIINGSGEQTRDYIYVKDVVQANLKALEKEGTFNIGTGKETSVQQLFQELKKILNHKKEAQHGPPIKGEVERNSLDITKAKKELKWEPTHTLNQGLKETVEWIKQHP